jgi:hypothetical protein
VKQTKGLTGKRCDTSVLDDFKLWLKFHDDWLDRNGIREGFQINCDEMRLSINGQFITDKRHVSTKTFKPSVQEANRSWVVTYIPFVRSD